jgi:hypothetical protein
MLNIFKLKKKDQLVTEKNNKAGYYIYDIKENIPQNKEWFNSIYVFNKNNNRLLPAYHNIVFYLIKSYFFMFNKNIEKVKTRRIDLRFRRLSARRIWVGKPEIKFTNDKLSITVYVYNREYNYYLKKLSKLNFIWGFLTIKIPRRKSIFFLRKFLKKYKKILLKWKTKKGNPFFIESYLNKNTEKNDIIINNKKKHFIDIIKKLKTDKNIILSAVTDSNNWELKSDYMNKLDIYFNYLEKCLEKEIAFLRYKQIMLFNKFKFKDNFLLPLINLLQKIYNKKVEFNIISLKNYYLSSSILSQIVLNKIRNKKNKPLRVLKKALRKIETPILNKRTIKPLDKKVTGIQNNILKFNKNKKHDKVEYSLRKNYVYNIENQLDDIVINNISNKLISGVFLKASGRITRRITAERSVSKFRYVGTLKNINSSYKKLSTVMSRGNNKSNVENTLLNSKTRIGAFGLKGWVASY